MKKFVIATMLTVLLCTLAFAKIVKRNGDAPGEKKTGIKGMYCVYSKDWFFGTPALPGWDFVEEDGSGDFNAYYCYPGKIYTSSPAIIYIRVMNKKGLNMKAALEQDMKEFSVQVSDAAYHAYPEGKNKRFVTASMIYTYRDRADFLTFLDPGKKYKFYLIFCLAGASKYTQGFESYFRELVSGFVAVGTRDELVLKP